MTQETSVLVIFEHSLLGEGLAARLSALGVHTVVAESCDSDLMVAALEAHPDVVVVECHNEGCLERIGRLSPRSRVVDASDVIGRGYPTEAMRFEVILEALKDDPPQKTPA